MALFHLCRQTSENHLSAAFVKKHTAYCPSYKYGIYCLQMTAAEKKNILSFVRAASAGISGYSDRSLDEGLFTFQDDIEPPQADPESISGGQASSTPAVAAQTAAAQAEASGISLQTIADKIARCQNCQLHAGRTNPVPGEGVPAPIVMVIGEGPGEMEDRSGRPFVGPAGQLLDKMLAAISLSRDTNCFIGNIVKCRPPSNRTPFPGEADACSPYLEAQIHVLKPKVILAVGSTAVKNLLATSEGISRLRGRFYDYKGIPLTATYHPSALLRDESLKRPAWEDLKVLRAWLEENAPGYDGPFKSRQG